MVTYLVIIASISTWQSNIFNYQLLVQVLFLFVVLIYGYKSIIKQGKIPQSVIIFSQDGKWLETVSGEQVSWQVSPQSRATRLVLFINIVSPLTPQKSQWRLIYKDQVNEQYFRRLCRVIIFQQQNATRII
ncbi:MAG: protein YgfX [Paraglaciecola sp.]|uniref:protein YgfX n=1 Tax=Paraglaciecola sp. TaxID=1920173 RepID=UPI00329983DC